MKTPTATFYAARIKGKNSPESTASWTIFCDVAEKWVADLQPKDGTFELEVVRITVEPLDEEAKKTTVTAERDFWRRAAAYLASCHAATAYHLLDKKSTPKSEKQRHLSIMQVCIELLSGRWPSAKLQSDDISSELKRCQDCHDHYKDKV